MPTLRRALTVAALGVLVALVSGYSCGTTPEAFFRDSFETGALTNWTDAVGAVAVSDAAAHRGSFGLRVDAASGTSSSVRVRKSFSPTLPGPGFRVSFDVRFSSPVSFSAAGQVRMPLAMLRLSASTGDAEILLRAINLGSASAPDLRFELLSLPDSGLPYARTVVGPELPPVRLARWQHVELEHLPASPGARDGRLRLYLDDDPYPALELAGLANSLQTQLYEARLGIVGTVQGASFFGRIDFDTYEVLPLAAWSDSFESGGASRWTELSGAGASVSAAAAAPGGGSLGLEIAAASLTGRAGVMRTFDREARRQLFEFDFRAASGLRLPRVDAALPALAIFAADFLADGESDVQLRIVNVAAVGAPEDLRWALRVRENGGCCRETPLDASAPPVALGAFTHIRIETLAARGSARDGEVRVFFDAAPFPALELTGLGTGLETTLREVRLGVAEPPIGSALDGVLSFDAFATRPLARPLPMPPNTVLSEDGALYRVVLWRNFAPGSVFQAPAPVVIEGGAADLDANGERTHAEAHVRVIRTPVGADTEWRIEVTPTPGSGYGVYRVEFPRLVVNPIRGDGVEKLYVPHGIGRVIHDPLHAAERVMPGSTPIGKFSVWYGTYGSSQQTLPLLAYEKNGRGVLVYTRDPSLRTKDFEVSSDTAPDYYGPGRRVAVHHYPDETGQPGVGWSSPYPVVTHPYATGWYEALREYRSWALAQPWAAGGPLLARIRSGDLPAWYVRNAVWATAIDAYQLPLLERIEALFAPVTPPVELGVVLTNWQAHESAWEKLPEYFPPKSHAESLAAGGPGCPEDCWYFDYLDRQATGRSHLFPYLNLHVAERDAAGAPTIPTLRLSDGSTLATASLLARALPGLFATPYLQAGGPNGHLPLCRAHAGWASYFSDLARRSVELHDPASFDPEFGAYGSDGQYFDQMVPGSVYPCFALDHGHPPGFGAHAADGLRAMAAAARLPGTVLMGEGVFEGAVGAVQESYATAPQWSAVEDVAPLFPAVYQGYAALHEWPFFLPETFPLFNVRRDAMTALTWPFHLGLKPGSFTGTATWERLLPEGGCARSDLCALLEELAEIAVRTMDVRAYGERLADPVLDDPGSHTPSWCVDRDCTARRKVTRPIVEASLWRSLEDPERVLLLLSNTGSTTRRVRVATPDLAPGQVLYDVTTGSTRVYDPAQLIATAPYRWLALVTKPLDDADADFVDAATDACPGVFDPTNTCD